MKFCKIYRLLVLFVIFEVLMFLTIFSLYRNLVAVHGELIVNYLLHLLHSKSAISNFHCNRGFNIQNICVKSEYVNWGRNYNRLNPKVVITPLKILNCDKEIKIIVVPATKINSEEKKRQIPNPTKKYKVNNDKENHKKCTNPSYKKSKRLLKVKMFGNVLKTKFAQKINKNELIQEVNSIFVAQTGKPQFSILNKISDTKSQINGLINLKEDKSVTLVSGSANNINSLRKCVETLEICDENNIVDTIEMPTDIDGDKGFAPITNNDLSSFYDKSKMASDTPLAENAKYKNTLEFISALNLPGENKNIESDKAAHSGQNSIFSAGNQKREKLGKSREMVKRSVKNRLKALENVNGKNKIDKTFNNNQNKKSSNFVSAKNKKFKTKILLTKSSNSNTLDKFFNVLKVCQINSTSVDNKEINCENKSKLLENNTSFELIDKENSSNKKMSYKQNSIEKYLNTNEINYIADFVSKEGIENINSGDKSGKSILKVATSIRN